MGLNKVDEHLYISGLYDVKPDILQRHNITCIINATPDCEFPACVQEMDLLRIPVADDPYANLGQYFDQAVEKIVETQNKGGNTLVHCIAGVSRSASLCLAYLMKHKGTKLRPAYHHLKQCRFLIHPNLGFFRQLVEYEKQLFGSNTVTMMESRSNLAIPDIYMDDNFYSI